MKDDNYPLIIYKYRSWNNEFHKKILTDGEVYLASPEDFNDPFDFGIVQNFFTLDTPEKIERYIDEGMIKHKEFLLSKGYDLAKEREFQLKRLQNLDEYQKEYEKLNAKAVNKSYGVLSLSGRWDSILMWSHYADFHRGFNIGYNEFKMRNSGLFGKGGPITYSDEYPHIDAFAKHTIESSFQQTHYKSIEWAYEEEYRLSKLFFPNTPTKANRTVKVPFEFVEEINLGIKVSPDDKAEILKLANDLNIKVFQTEKVPFKFKLTRNPINK
ncbi:DUF2971 domain-containing protein [Chryseobacterium sp. IT-36CA2]|uniref:DUF2971 domain-containing protein n=1 Tax=Chryseobacterium sp. IT-36CA2 TaxID=3026460 RepID=UPI0039E04DE7